MNTTNETNFYNINDYFKENKWEDFSKEECLIIVLTNGDSFDYPLEIRNETHKEDIIEKIATCIDENIVIEVHKNDEVFYLNPRNIVYFYFKSTDSSFNEYKRNLLNYMKHMEERRNEHVKWH